MNTKSTTISIILTLLLVLSSSGFSQEESSAETYSGTLASFAEKTFKVKARKGQYINAKITSERGNVLIAEEEGATELTMEAVVPEYELVIRNQGNRPEKYELKITVFTPEPEPADDVSPAEGSRTRTYELTMYPYKFKRRFSVKLKKGEGAKIRIEPAESAARLTYRLETSDDYEGEKAFPFLIRADRDGEFVFELSKSDEVILEAMMTIEILSEEEFRNPANNRTGDRAMLFSSSRTRQPSRLTR